MMRKRKLSDEQVKMLEQSFGSEHKLESERKDKLAAELGLDPRQVAVWFQNRRARWKSKKLEEEYSKLKSDLDVAVVHKCRLETEVLYLYLYLYLYPFLSLIREFYINFCVILMMWMYIHTLTHSSGVCGLPNLDLVLIFSTSTGLIT